MYLITFFFLQIYSARLSEKSIGPAGPQVFIFYRQNKYSGRQKLYFRINGSIFVTDNGLSLVYIFPKKKVTYLGGQVGEQAWKFGRHWVKAGRIGDPTGRNVEPWFMFFISKEELSCTIFSLFSWQDCYSWGTFLVVELRERINIILSCSQSFVASPLKDNSTHPLFLPAMQATLCIKHFLLPESRSPMKVTIPWKYGAQKQT